MNHARLELSKKEYHDLCLAVLERDKWLCRNQLCRSKRGLQIDHIKPRSGGGPDDILNLWALCEKCHRLKELGILVPIQQWTTGEWIMVDRRCSVQCMQCLQIKPPNEIVFPTEGGGIQRASV